MNQPTPYQTQIIQKDNEVVIALASPLNRFINKYLFAISAVLVVAPILASIQFLSPLLALLSFVLIVVFYAFRYLLRSDVVITKAIIKNDNYMLALEHIPYLDIQTKATANGINVKIGKIRFELKNPEDLPLLTEVITRKTNLEFYENYQLSDKSDVITYKAKHIAKPIFSTFLTVQNQQDKVRVYDMTSNRQFTWFEIKKQQTTYIQYSKPVSDDQSIVSTVDLNDIEKIQVIIKNGGHLFNPFRQVKVLVLEKQKPSKGIVKLQHYLYEKAKITYNQRYIFKSELRQAVDELTNLRDGEKIYEVLNNLPSLANIKIEKVMLTS